MDLFNNLGIGFDAALSLNNLTFCFVGVLVGTAIGILPGLGPLATIAMLLPLTYSLEPVTGLIMIAGIYYGAQYGGSTTAILVNLPGESSAIVSCLDGHQMARKGRAGAALAIAAIGSFFAGTVATLLIAGFSPILAEVAFLFGPVEYFAMMVLGLTAATLLAHGSFIKGVAMVLTGLILGLVGADVNSGTYRFTFGSFSLTEGIEFVAVAMGLFAFTDIVTNIRNNTAREVTAPTLGNLWMSRKEAKQAAFPILRGTMIGSVLGLLPGGGAMISSFASYAMEKRLSRHPEEFGHGAVAGLAGPEAANNAGAQTSFIPMLTLGIPSNGVMALMIGALMVHNIAPGPFVMVSNPDIFWGLIASMWIGNAILIVLNLPLIPLWVRLIRVNYWILFPIILTVCCVGLYSIGNRVLPIYFAAGFTLLGCLFWRMRAEAAPLLLGFILGPLMEEHFRRALLLSNGDVAIFYQSPLSVVMLGAAAIICVIVLLPQIRRGRSAAFVEEA
ncbi:MULTISPECIES: tripartite tricarboxylate transporter permease [unclassified Neorhizobium]|uniref:tripartite tricarboxylate transporter permease n=1 Tax=unclassified Neorhizobium TaxID=2629175 RepID=UPI001FF46510|nr:MULTISPECIES: tripartite tricarboxylate transporter permease [unclassified Neorhizobium]MCJ9669431.1 tripartite tricarboxylate transporter permease [Neorhizobium sp. SHOUNA12B]MCJ9745544.1 tripartite tricarboxylate transporter permease [Neorhizobium sp. SHOUNA12A]